MNIQQQSHIPVQLANAWFAKGKLAQASSFYQQAIKIDVTCSAAHFGLGRIALYTGQPAAALGHFEQALQLDPDNYRLQI
ncbi:MAG: tetratricopeptide repeat protein, partial [Chloroflexi bacterium]|nr:tetratricopeptide repeat protein [Chloroflexota bacterium]